MKEVVELSKNGIMATISLKGAELISLKKADKSSILWEKDDVFWNRTAPNLFPIVGRLFNDSYSFEGETYHMSQHGFVRDQNFSVSNQSSESVDLNLMWNEESLERYPFKYDLTIRYTLTENGVNVQYVVKNVDDKKIGFSIGGHPGFQLKDELDMYKLVFSNPF
jgi:galactose mutarotase-like enzyme